MSSDGQISSADTESTCHHRKIYWTALVWRTGAFRSVSDPLGMKMDTLIFFPLCRNILEPNGLGKISSIAD